MTAISSASTAAAYQAPSTQPPAAKPKIDSDGDQDNSPPTKSTNATQRAVNVVA